jgi:hypothetical protein
MKADASARLPNCVKWKSFPFNGMIKTYNGFWPQNNSRKTITAIIGRTSVVAE